MAIEVIDSIAGLRKRIKHSKQMPDQKVGFVPTMGYLHEGHASLIKEARKHNHIVVLSIFVNPLQFGPNEDLDKYPRDLQRDLRLAEEAGVDIVFCPSVEEMYPSPILTTVSVRNVTERLCGASRPGHFDGVATVVTKLLNIVQPDRVYFGMKDAQQVAVITQMVHDLNMAVEVVPCPTIREEDGLAKSSRNVYLSAEERQQAIIIHLALTEAEQGLRDGTITADHLKEQVSWRIMQAPLARIDYVEVLEYPSLLPLVARRTEQQSPTMIIIAAAVRFGSTRLIDNTIITI